MQSPQMLRIFIVENDLQTRVNLRHWYEENGHEVLSASTSRDALRILAHILRPDLILLGTEAREVFSHFHTDENLKNVPKASIIYR